MSTSKNNSTLLSDDEETLEFLKQYENTEGGQLPSHTPIDNPIETPESNDDNSEYIDVTSDKDEGTNEDNLLKNDVDQLLSQYQESEITHSDTEHLHNLTEDRINNDTATEDDIEVDRIIAHYAEIAATEKSDSTPHSELTSSNQNSPDTDSLSDLNLDTSYTLSELNNILDLPPSSQASLQLNESEDLNRYSDVAFSSTDTENKINDIERNIHDAEKIWQELSTIWPVIFLHPDLKSQIETLWEKLKDYNVSTAHPIAKVDTELESDDSNTITFLNNEEMINETSLESILSSYEDKDLGTDSNDDKFTTNGLESTDVVSNSNNSSINNEFSNEYAPDDNFYVNQPLEESRTEVEDAIETYSHNANIENVNLHQANDDGLDTVSDIDVNELSFSYIPDAAELPKDANSNDDETPPETDIYLQTENKQDFNPQIENANIIEETLTKYKESDDKIHKLPELIDGEVSKKDIKPGIEPSYDTKNNKIFKEVPLRPTKKTSYDTDKKKLNINTSDQKHTSTSARYPALILTLVSVTVLAWWLYSSEEKSQPIKLPPQQNEIIKQHKEITIVENSIQIEQAKDQATHQPIIKKEESERISETTITSDLLDNSLSPINRNYYDTARPYEISEQEYIENTQNNTLYDTNNINTTTTLDNNQQFEKNSIESNNENIADNTSPRDFNITSTSTIRQHNGKIWSLNLESIHQSKVGAVKIVKKLNLRNIPAELKPINIEGNIWYRIRITGFNSKQDAQEYMSIVKKNSSIKKSWVSYSQ